MKKWYIPSGYYWWDEIEFEEESEEYLLETIAITCLKQKKGDLVSCLDLSDEEFDKYDRDDRYGYVDLTPWGYGCYFINVCGAKEVK